MQLSRAEHKQNQNKLFPAAAGFINFAHYFIHLLCNVVKKDNLKAREVRKALELKMNAGVAAVKRANEQTDPLEQLPSFRRFQKNGVDLKLETRRVTELGEDTKTWVADLMERNMKEMYIRSQVSVV